MSRKVLLGVIAVLLLSLISVSVISVRAYSDLSRQLRGAQGEYAKLKSRTDFIVNKSGHFAPPDDWASRPHAKLVLKTGATVCFDCHSETSCSDCHTKPARDRESKPTSVPAGVKTLMADLRSRGHEVGVAKSGNPGWLFQDVPAAGLLVDGSDITVWQFASEKDATAAMRNIARDGTVLKQMGTTTMGTKDGMRYPAPPHYFVSDRLVILYFAFTKDRASGHDRKVLETLASVVGTQVAGE